MRVKYEKPLVAVERYELSQTISACSIKISLNTNGCVLEDPDTPIDMWYLAMNFPNYFSSGCMNMPTAGFDSSSTGICYHTNANATFTS